MQRGTFAHVRLAADGAGVVRAVGADARADVQQAGVVEARGVGDDLIVQVGEAVCLLRERRRGRRGVRADLEDGGDVDRVGVGEAEEGGRGLLRRLEVRETALHRRMLHLISMRARCSALDARKE